MELGKFTWTNFNRENSGEYEFHFENGTDVGADIITIQFYTDTISDYNDDFPPSHETYEQFEIESVLIDEEYVERYNNDELKLKLEQWMD
jgi:hypothetical protein